MKAFFSITAIIVLLSYSAKAQIVNIPDANFKRILVTTACALVDTTTLLKDVDTNNDGEIQVTEALAVRRLGVASQLIASLTGIESFTNLKMLECGYNQLTTLNVQGLTSLDYLDCQYNQLLTLNVQTLTNLAFLYCNNNLLTSLNVQPLTNLRTLWCSANRLTTLNVQSSTNLQALECYTNLLTSLFIQNGQNETSLNFYNNPNLTYICCDATQITAVQNQATQHGYTNCVVDAACVVGTNNSIATMFSLTLQPNPVADILTFKTLAIIEKCKVYDALGRIVALFSVQNQSINVEHLPKGVYFIKAYSNSQVAIQQFVKQ